MGVMARLFGFSANSGTAADGSHSIRKGQVFSPGGGFSPTDPGTFGKVNRTAPRVEEPRYFTPKEAAVLKQLEGEVKKRLNSSKQAYQSLKSIDNADTSLQGLHVGYKKHIAGNELKKQQLEGDYAKLLHGQRSKYAALGTGLDKAELSANKRISEIRSKLNSDE